MKVLCVGADQTSVASTESAFRVRWPESQVVVPSAPGAVLTLLEDGGVDLVIFHAGGSDDIVPMVCGLREFSDVPLIVLGDQDERGEMVVKALQAGADDFIDSTVGQAERIARVAALIRRVADLSLAYQRELRVEH